MDVLFLLIVGIPIGTSCVPLLVDLFYLFVRGKLHTCILWRGFSRKTKRSCPDHLFSLTAISMMSFTRKQNLNLVTLLIVSIPLSLRIPQMQSGLLHTLTYTSKCTVRVDLERIFTTKEKISIFPLWTFCLYVATCIWSISLSWSDIPALVVSIMISLIEGCC